ncbi:MAG: cation:proton antiporter [Candidatus Sabulitectum sp.]|nr:cation:proton antiporter [Candidatus Sabulitectum sp.]
METEAIFILGTLLFTGFIAGRVASKFGLPAVTGYILAGVLLNPQVSGIISPSFVNSSDLVTIMTLSIITFSVGTSLYLPKIRKLGKTIGVVALFEAQFANFFIAAGFAFLIPILLPGKAQYAVPMALLFGALGSPTDPSATLAVAHQFKCDGPVTRTVMGVAAMDDGIGMLNYSIAAAAAAVLIAHTSFTASSILSPLLRIGSSLAIGAFIGALFALLEKKMNINSTAQMLALLLGSLYSCYGISMLFNADPLLAVMTMGFVVVNAGEWCRRIPEKVSGSIEEIVFILFFTVSGMKLDFSVLKSSALLVLLFVILRVTGKFAGTIFGARLASAPIPVRKYTGFCLVPQGGIVIGLALILHSMPVFQPFADTLVSVILGTVVINELVGPLLSRWALKKAGEIHS